MLPGNCNVLNPAFYNMPSPSMYRISKIIKKKYTITNKHIQLIKKTWTRSTEFDSIRFDSIT